MRAISIAASIGAVLAAAAAPLAAASLNTGDGAAVSAPQPRRGGVLQCVPYARRVTGIPIYGDAHTWWGQAAGKFARGTEPRVGAVMNLRPHGGSRLGHVAAVSKIVDDRTILIKHANWSERGRIENNVRVIDVSKNNDWSAVRVWNGKSQRMGGGTWPLYGFIYNEKPGKSAKPAKARKPSDDAGTRLAAISGTDEPVTAAPRLGKIAARKPGKPLSVKPALARPLAKDPIGAIIAGG